MERKLKRVNINRHKNKAKITTALAITIAFVLIFLIIAVYISKEHKRQIELTESHLIEATESNAAIVCGLFSYYVESLRALSMYIKQVDDLKSPETFEILKGLSDSFGLERLSILFPDGSAYDKDGVPFTITDDEYLDLIRKGEIFVSDVVDAIIDGTPIVVIQVPLHRDGQVIASLRYSIEIGTLDGIIKSHLPNGDKYSFIVDENGKYVSIGSTEHFTPDMSFFDSLELLAYNDGYSEEMVEKAFTDSKSGHTEYLLNGTIRYGYYAPVGINNWVMLTVIPKDIVDAETNEFLGGALWLSVQIALILIIASIFVYMGQKRLREEAELDEYCFRILAESAGKVVMEWNYEKKIMNHHNFENAVGRKPLINSYRTAEEAIEAETVHPDDCDIFRKAFADMTGGKNVESVRYRIRDIDEAYQYYSLSSVVVFNAKGKPYKSIGFFENIDSQIREEERLRLKADTDQLTGLYNKTSAEAAITEILTASDKKTVHAFLCADLDNFKSINDEFGHLYGDKVLIEMADSIKQVFRKSDILCRFGGDEFVIFVTDIPSKKFIEEKAADLNKRMNKTYRQDDMECTISASIGIAISEKDGDTYKALYAKADEASYAVKNSGKNSYCFAS